MSYKVFIRNWWKWKYNSNGEKCGKEPEPNGRRTHLAYADSEQEAREIAQKYNSEHNPGPLSRKAEFTKY